MGSRNSDAEDRRTTSLRKASPMDRIREPEIAPDDDICGLCGQRGADKIPHPIRWPGERAPDGDLVHASCENEECGRAHAELSDKERDEFLRSIR